MTEASVLFFVHNTRDAQDVLLTSCTDEEGTMQRELLEKKHKEFIDFVIS